VLPCAGSSHIAIRYINRRSHLPSDHGRSLVRTPQTPGHKWQTGGMTTHKNLLGGPDPTYLPENEEAYRLLGEESRPPAEVAAKYPTFSLAWAMLADDAFEAGRVIESYAYARTGYHRGLDSLRRAGWKGHGPIPWDHRANRGFLRCLAALARAAGEIDEKDETERCWQFLKDSSTEAYAELKR
jgi:hypothetical protein